MSDNNKNLIQNLMKNIHSTLGSDKNKKIKLEILECLEKLYCNKIERYFYSHPSYNDTFNKDWWDLRPDSNSSFSSFSLASKNPYLVFLKEYKDILSSDSENKLIEIHKSFAWLNLNNPGLQDWIRV